jgi:hypothetical protein
MKIPHKGFEAKINKTDTCWLWTGHINSYGYGRFNGKGMPSGYAHRAMFFWANGYLPTGCKEVVGHLCEVRNCVNPKHLTKQTQSDNVRQYSEKITECPKGHEYSDTNTYIRKNGSRKCRECNRLNEARKRGQ